MYDRFPMEENREDMDQYFGKSSRVARYHPEYTVYSPLWVPFIVHWVTDDETKTGRLEHSQQGTCLDQETLAHSSLDLQPICYHHSTYYLTDS